MIRVKEIAELVFPNGTELVAGKGGLSTETTWATRPRPGAPAFGHLSGGELVLLTEKSMKNLDQRMTLDAAIGQLAGFGISAIAFSGIVSKKAIAAADRASIPLFQLPKDADLAQVERDSALVIGERRRDSQRQSHDASRRLMEMSISGDSLTDLATALAEIAKLDVVIEGRDDRLLAMSSNTGRVPSTMVISPLLERGRQSLNAWLRDVSTASPAEPPTSVIPWNHHASRVVAPIIGREGMLGALSLILPGNDASGPTRALASKGAAASAVVLARERAAAVARQELELNVLDEILDGALRSEVSLIQQAKRLGHNLDGLHVAIVARMERQPGQVGPRARLEMLTIAEEVVGRGDASVLWRYRNQNAEIVWPVNAAENPERIGEELHQRLLARASDGGNRISIGAGSALAGIAGIRESHQQARQALNMGRKLNGVGSVTHFDDLGVYRLLFSMREEPELRRFHDDALRQLIEYDEQNHADLVNTLGAYFAGRCGPKETAAMLGIHRNTVLYRLERIQEIAGIDLDDAHVRLRMHLAYCAHVALFADSGSAFRKPTLVEPAEMTRT